MIILLLDEKKVKKSILSYLAVTVVKKDVSDKFSQKTDLKRKLVVFL